MDDPDWESFIANVESSAPKVEIDDERHRCQECDTVLENIDGDFICPGCSAQATNILQLEQTDIYCDDSGRIFLGQAVNLHAKKSRRQKTDYGWAWSTDDAIVHILSLQIESLEKLGLVSGNFRPSITNMWLKYWLEYVAPFIRDEYNQDDLKPFKTTSSLKTRDIEVLIKVRDKVMIPEWACRSRAAREEAGKKRNRKSKSYNMMGTSFLRKNPLESSDSDDMDIDNELKASLAHDEEVQSQADNVSSDPGDANDLNQLRPEVNSTRNISKDNVNILTLNRTLAFIEATARLIEMPEPLFAADIIRACTQRIIPFYGAQKALPENVRSNYEDRQLFKVTSPPSTNQLTRATSLLIHKVYRDKFPSQAPVPNCATILERFTEDMNLPRDILQHLKDVDFSSFKQTKQAQLPESKAPTLQHYDRWAFAILICQLKRIYSFDDESLSLQSDQVRDRNSSERYFVVRDWLRQLNIRLKLIMSFDPYVLHHPMASIRDLAPTGEMFKFIETTLGDKAQATTRLFEPRVWNDSAFRSDLTDFLRREVPKPRCVAAEFIEEAELQKPTDPKHPLQDSFRRTQHLWQAKVEGDKGLADSLFRNFTNDKILLPDHGRRWSIYETTSLPESLKLDISLDWPYSFRLLLHVGGFICFCDPRDLLREVRFVEEYLYAGMRASYIRRNSTIRNRSQQNRWRAEQVE